MISPLALAAGGLLAAAAATAAAPRVRFETDKPGVTRVMPAAAVEVATLVPLSPALPASFASPLLAGQGTHWPDAPLWNPQKAPDPHAP